MTTPADGPYTLPEQAAAVGWAGRASFWYPTDSPDRAEIDRLTALWHDIPEHLEWGSDEAARIGQRMPITREWGSDELHDAVVGVWARYLGALGLRLHPLLPAVMGNDDTGKKAMLTGWNEVATNEPAQLDEWFGPNRVFRFRQCNYGVLADASIVMVDVDVKEGQAGRENLLALLAGQPGLLTGAIAIRTGRTSRVDPKSGQEIEGRHFWFRNDPNAPQPTIKNGGLEIRGWRDGKGAYVVGPGSRHYSGVRYAPLGLMPGLETFQTRPTAIVPQVIIDRIGELKAEDDVSALVGKSERAGVTRLNIHSDPVPAAADALIANTVGLSDTSKPSPPSEMMGLLGTDRDTFMQAKVEEVVDRIINAPDGCQESVFNNEVLKLGGLCGAGVFDVEDAAELLISLLLANPALSRAGKARWTPNEVRSKVQRSLFDGMHRPFDGVRYIDQYKLQSNTSYSKDFPVEAIVQGPRRLKDTVKAFARQAQSHPVLALMSVMANVSAAAMLHVLCQRHDDSEDTFPPSLMMMAFADSGERKSGVMKKTSQGMRRHFAKRMVEYRKAKKEYEAATKARDAERKGGRSKNAGDPTPMPIVRPVGPAPRYPVFLTEEPTTAAMEVSLNRDHPALLLMTSEGSKLLDGYEWKGKNLMAMVALCNNAYDGEALTRHRAKEAEPLYMQNRVFGMFTAQQHMFKSRVYTRELIAQGFMSRVLGASLEPMPPRLKTKPDPNADPFSEEALSAFADNGLIWAFGDHLESLFDASIGCIGEDGLQHRTKLPLTLEAGDLLIDAYNKFQQKMGKGGEYWPIRGFASKMGDHVQRWATATHVFGYGPLGSVGNDDVLSAITIVEWFATDFLRELEEGGVSENIADAGEMLEWAVGWERSNESSYKHKQTIRFGDMRSRGPGRLRSKENVDRVLAVLLDHGQLIRIQGSSELFIPELARKNVAALWGIKD